MPFGKTSLALVAVLAMASGATAVSAQTLTPAQTLAAQIVSDLTMLSTNNAGAPTDAMIQSTIAADLAISTASLSDKEAALLLVEQSKALPPGALADLGIAYAALEQTGSFVAASGGGAQGGSSFGSTGSGGGLGGGSGGSPYKAPA
jgi:hypothetical protein